MNDTIHNRQAARMQAQALKGMPRPLRERHARWPMRPYRAGYVPRRANQSLPTVLPSGHVRASEPRGIPYFDPVKAERHWQALLGYVTRITQASLPILVVATRHDVRRRSRSVLGDVLARHGGHAPVTRVNTQWMHGRRTNLPTLRARVRQYRTTPTYERRPAQTKRFETHIEPLESFLRGERRPGRVRFLHPQDHPVALRECHVAGVPTAAIANSNRRSLDHIDYVLPGNDQERSAQHLYRERVRSAVQVGMSLRSKANEANIPAPRRRTDRREGMPTRTGVMAAVPWTLTSTMFPANSKARQTAYMKANYVPYVPGALLRGNRRLRDQWIVPHSDRDELTKPLSDSERAQLRLKTRAPRPRASGAQRTVKAGSPRGGRRAKPRSSAGSRRARTTTRSE